MAQLMQLLEYQQKNKQLRQLGELGNRELDLRGQQIQQQGSLGGRELDIRDRMGGRELDLRNQQMLQQGEQYQSGLGLDREKLGAQKQQWEAELQQKMLDRALEQSRFAQTNPLQQEYMKAQIANMAKPDPRLDMLQQTEKDQAMEYLQTRLGQVPPDSPEAQQLNAQLAAYAKQRFGSLIPPPPPLTIDQINRLKALGQPIPQQ